MQRIYGFSKTIYLAESPTSDDNDVVFINERGDKLVRKFDSPYHARLFANKVRRNKKLVLCCEPARR